MPKEEVMKGSEQEKFLKEQCDLFAFVPLNWAERFKGLSLRRGNCQAQREMEGKKKRERGHKEIFYYLTYFL